MREVATGQESAEERPLRGAVMSAIYSGSVTGRVIKGSFSMATRE